MSFLILVYKPPVWHDLSDFGTLAIVWYDLYELVHRPPVWHDLFGFGM